MASVARYKFVPSMIHEKDDVFLQVLDEDSILTGLRNEMSPTKRISILESLRMSVRRSGGQLHIQERFSLFNAINNILLDNDVNTRLACLNLVCEVIPDFGSALDECMALILPQLVVFIAHNQVSLKKLAVQTLHVYMKHSEHLENVLNAIIQHGLESDNMDTQMESLIALPILITPNFADEDLFSLTEALVGRIAGNSSTHANSGTDTTSLAMISLERIRNVVGKRNFDIYVQRLQPRLQTVLNKTMKSVGSDNDKSKSRKSKSAGVSTEDASHGVNIDKTKLNRGLTIAGISHEAVVHHKSDARYIPPGIMGKFKDTDWRLKVIGIEELQAWLDNGTNLEILLPHLQHFISVLKELVNDSNFKVNLSCLQLFGAIIDKLGAKVEPVLEILVNVLCSKLGDNKNVMKQTNMQVFKKLMQNVSPKRVLEVLKGNIKHRNSRVREETLNVIIASLLTFPSNTFDLPQLTNDIAPALLDPKSRVRHAALEAFAVISQLMGRSNLQPLVSSVDNIELNMGGDGVMAAVQARFARRQLPKLNMDGLVEYAVPLPSSGSAKVNANMSPRGADVEWILAAGVSSDGPLSARSTPGLSDSASSSPHRHLSAGKSRLPWENGKSTSDTNEDHPQKLKNSWALDDHHDIDLGATKTNKGPPPHSSYAVKYSNRKASTSSNPPESSNPVTSYAQLHKSKSAKSQSFSTKTVKGNNLGPIMNGTNGYSLIYKKGGLGNKAIQDHPNSFDPNNHPRKPLVRNNSVGGKSLSPLNPSSPKSPAARRKTNTMMGVKNNVSLSASLPDWSELSNRQRKLLSSVSSSGMSRDEEHPSLSNPYVESPIQTKPTLVKSASRKGRGLKSIDPVSNMRLPNAASPTMHSPVPLREQQFDGYQHMTSGGRNLSPLSSDTEDSPRKYKSMIGNKTWSSGSRNNEDDILPFDTKPRIARTPLHIKHQTSSDGTNVADQPHMSGYAVKQHNEIEIKKNNDMEIVGHAFDSPEKKTNQTMKSTLGSTSGIGSSLEESGELRAGFECLLRDRGEDEVEDYELDYEDDTDSQDDLDNSDDQNLKNGQLLRDYKKQIVDTLDDDDTYSDTMEDDGSDGESLEDSEGYEESDEDDDKSPKRSSSSDEYDNSRSERQSLSKSTRERMERKRIEEEQRILRERQRIEEIQNQSKIEAKEQNLRAKLAKEQQEIEDLIKRKEKEKKYERMKQEKLLQQFKKKTENEEFLKSKNQLEDLEAAKEVHRQKERAETLKKIQQKKNDFRVSNEVTNEHLEDLTVQGYHTPTVSTGMTNKQPPAVSTSTAVNRTLPVVSSTLVDKQAHAVSKTSVEKPAPAVSKTSVDKPAPVVASAAVHKPVVTRPPLSSPKKKSENASHNHHVSSQAESVSESSKQSHSLPVSSSVPIWEVAVSELHPFSNGDAAIKTTLKLLDDTEWEVKCDGLLCVRRLIRHHVDDVVQQLHVLILAVVAEVKNLRSQVSRAGIYVLGDMFTCLERNMDLDLELTTNALLKKAGESSSFIRGDVERSLGCMISSVSPSKAISTLVAGGSSHRNVNVRKTAARFLCLLAERMGPARCLSGSKDITERILVAAATFASDGGADTRYYGRYILHMLDGHADFDKMLKKYLPSKSLEPTLSIINNLRSKGLGDPPSDISSARARKAPVTSGVGSRGSSIVSTDGGGISTSNVASPVSNTSRESSRRRARRVSHDAPSPQDQEDIGRLVEQLSSKDWQDRILAIDSMEEIIETRLSLFTSNIVKIMDGFSPRLLDNNSKVNLHALQCLERVIPTLRDSLNSCVASVVPILAKNLASKNNNIGNMAENVLNSFIKHLDNARLLQPLGHFILVSPGGIQNRPSAVKKLLIIIKDVYPRKPNLVLKHALPVLWKLLESSSSASYGSGNMKESVKSLANLLYSLMGESLFDQAQTKSHRLRQKLKELLDQ
ncbi:TOG array regulator of axonemal microtubules protein 1-like isoform X3 [Dendronephthya gigantea]|uniref:TOG array regulator of axonemal microtubules protein 1-like isoform X3 n=1 Tax=Dendronephthya gigantea TaxID=151771 RepID=UPI001069FB5F|nr:TOG array regulator of axonemal microtubules protein 1-like isoform X3 [Dendronephthya gigantea]